MITLIWELLITEALNELGEDSASLGFDLGVKLMEILAFKHPLRLDDPSLKLKMVSFELWSLLFPGKHLQEVASASPSCVLWDTNDLSWLFRLPPATPTPPNFAIHLSRFFAGIIQGGVFALNLNAEVAARLDKLPTCRFIVELKK
ncbi:hypothetical protein RCL1_002037 [Eukaryota sp. TZLM3-RCL]